jgi:hypothetical protein
LSRMQILYCLVKVSHVLWSDNCYAETHTSRQWITTKKCLELVDVRNN